MIDKDRIAVEAELFFEWPDPKRKDHVTLTSCLIFAAKIAEMVRNEAAAEIERLISDRDSWAQQASDRTQDALDLVAAANRRQNTSWALMCEKMVAAERERIRSLVEAVRDENAASQDADDCLIYTPALQRAWEALMDGLERPNVGVEAP